MTGHADAAALVAAAINNDHEGLALLLADAQPAAAHTALTAFAAVIHQTLSTSVIDAITEEVQTLAARHAAEQ